MVRETVKLERELFIVVYLHFLFSLLYFTFALLPYHSRVGARDRARDKQDTPFDRDWWVSPDFHRGAPTLP